jgi:uncharacterized membrane protein
MYYQPRDAAAEPAPNAAHDINISQPERTLSLLGAAGAIAAGLYKRDPLGAVLIALGGYLGFRGLTGHCYINEALGVNTAEREPGKQVSIPHQQGIRVDKAITINRSADDLYAFWRNLTNLPRVMYHLESVTTEDGNRSHWVAKAPAGLKVEWDAEIINDVPGERIGWRSLEGASVPNAGAVIFRPAPQGQGTELQISLKYDPPGGAIGATVARLFGEDPALQIQEDLFRFRQLIEAGEIATTAGQPSGRDKNADLQAIANENPDHQVNETWGV